MKAERLVALFDRMADMPDAVGQLRRLVRDLAVRGKLIEQDPADETAPELLKRLEVEKVRMVTAGEIRKPRDLANGVDLETPFQIPASWCWCRLDAIGAIVGGGTPPASDPRNFAEQGAGVAWLTPKDLGGYRSRYIGRGSRDLSPTGLNDSSATLMPAGTVLFSSRAPIGYVAIAENPVATNQGFKSVVPYESDCSKYIALALRTLAPEIEARASGTTFKEVSGRTMAGVPFPLPPLAEQHRIVGKVDELMALCERLEVARTVRESARDRLTKASLTRITAPDADAPSFRSNVGFAIDALSELTARTDLVKQLRQAILKLAAQGKLVEQRATEEPASELLKRIATEEARRGQFYRPRAPRSQVAQQLTEVPWSLPSAWQWVQLDRIADFRSGRTPPRKEPRYWNTGHFPWVSIGDMEHGQTLRSTKESVSAAARREVFKREPEPSGTIIMSFKLTIGKVARLGLPAFHNEAIVAIRPHLADLDPFLFQFLPEFARRATPKGAVKGATLNRNSLARITVPLPPLAEQHRIVAKVAELMTLCDGIEAALAATNTARRHLLASALHDILKLPPSGLRRTTDSLCADLGF